MATHDYVIANQSGAAFRTDLNNALAAIVSNNSNSSQPATRYAYQWWADTSAGVMKIRNSANDGWIELFQLDGTLTLEDGSAANPALAFRDDLNTGIFSSAENKINFSCGGGERLELGSETIFNEDGADVDFRIESDSNTHMFYVDAGNNRIGINDATPEVALDIAGQAKCTGLGIGSAPISGQHITILTENPRILIKSSGTNAAKIFFGDNASTDPGTIEYSHSDNTMRFSTNNTEKFRIDSIGRVSINTTTLGLSQADDITIANTDHCGITIRSGSTKQGNIFFTDLSSGDMFQGFVQYDHNDNSLAFGTSKVQAMQINSSQNVRIGDDELSGTGGRLKVASDSGQTYVLLLAEKGGQGMGIATRLDGTGNASTAIRFFDGPGAASVSTVSVNATSVTYGTGSSDRTMKKNFENWTDSVLNSFKNLNPQKFNYLVEDDTDEKHKGFVAQDLVADFPEAYPKDIETDKYSFNPSGMVVYLMKAIQELESKVAALEAA
tara:strand:- start:731 stop:2224 length:1494 start_codon:yes stop_codon:yes gene_type:complete